MLPTSLKVRAELYFETVKAGLRACLVGT